MAVRIREVRNADGSYIIARPQDEGTYLVTATANDDALTQVQGIVSRNEAGFRGRQWESSIDGQQYATLKEAMTEAMRLANARAESAAWWRNVGTRS